ncbi:MAG: hypothetical protein ACLRXC_08325 [[Clostridium] leptum]
MKLLIIDDDALVCASLKTIWKPTPVRYGTGGSGGKLFLYRRCGPMCC